MLSADDPFACIDLDVKASTPPEDVQRFEAIIDTMDSYTERSRSGLGFHVWVRGQIGKGRRRDGVEVYSQERFIICTGNIVRDRPVSDRQELLSNMVEQMRPEPTEIAMAGDNCPDYALAERAICDEGELGRLWRGEWEGRYPSQSEADLALVKLLAPQTDSPAECWKTFRLSRLGQRDKADRSDYARSTLGQAVAHLSADAYSAKHGGEVIASWLPVTVREGRRGLRLLIDSDLDTLPKLRWMVKGVIPDAGIGAVYGDSGSYKSFLVLDMLAHISNGREWFGHRVKAAPAVYVPFEGQGGIPNRVRAWRVAQTAARYPQNLATFEPDTDVLSKIAVVMEPLNLREADDRAQLVSTLKSSGWAGGVLCIDTLAHASAGIEENSSAMGEMIGIFRELQHELGGVILLVHHSGKDQSRGMRGWSGLHAAMDFVVECQREGEPQFREANFKLSKVKDGTTGTRFGFQMEVVPLGFDEDGDAITSLTVNPRDGEEGGYVPPFKGAAKAGIRDIDAATSAQDDAFIDNWVRQQVLAGNYPSKNSLKGQLPDMKATGYQITQDRVLAAVERLLAEERLTVESEVRSSSGNVWIRPIDQAPSVGSLALPGFAGRSLAG
ncbi:AAA family ATPase [Blastomonas fulva]|uniref:AAA family ATPase n=1 Tax=Blastomonas fulva TaxID=1550728 RepID=UPI0025A465E0|nr:AAA family ATPase [Blastomonas fulva]MDM7930029.1 AAA family ATPase [Blastomonas fulva]MDM7966206.1 AAA family ATPase [Blastomonas fulva]